MVSAAETCAHNQRDMQRLHTRGALLWVMHSVLMPPQAVSCWPQALGGQLRSFCWGGPLLQSLQKDPSSVCLPTCLQGEQPPIPSFAHRHPPRPPLTLRGHLVEPHGLADRLQGEIAVRLTAALLAAGQSGPAQLVTSDPSC
jgi:hypothetical protein